MMDILFILALILGAGAIDNALDDPVAAAIAIGSAVFMAIYVKTPESGNSSEA